MKEDCSATSYVTATFHSTIGQCAHQSLSTTDTLELGMIPQGTKEQQGHTHSQIHIKPNHAKNTFGFIRLLGKQANSIRVPWTYSAKPTITPKTLSYPLTYGSLGLTQPSKHFASTHNKPINQNTATHNYWI